MFNYLLSIFYYYLFIIASWFNRNIKKIFIFNSVYILNDKLEKQNKTLEFYISYFSNFKIKNKKYYKICITNQDNLSKIFTNIAYKELYDEYKKLITRVNNKNFTRFIINKTDYKDIVKSYCFYDNTILDFYLFNMDDSIRYNIDKLKSDLDNMEVEYVILDISNHKLIKDKKIINDVNENINSLQ